MCNSAAVVIESIEVREFLRFLILPCHLKQTFAAAA